MKKVNFEGVASVTVRTLGREVIWKITSWWIRAGKNHKRIKITKNNL
jgi:hypothetical protein